MEQTPLATQEQSQSIESGKPIASLGHLLGKLMEQRRTDEHQTSEVEIVADAAQLVVDNRMSRPFSVEHCVVVAIDHRSLHLRSGMNHAQRGVESQQQRSVFRIEKHIVGRHVSFYLTDGRFRLHAVDDHKRTVGRSLGLLSHLLTDHQEYMMNHSCTAHLLDGGLHLLQILAGQETINSFSHNICFYNCAQRYE